MKKSIICILLAIFTAAIVGCGGSSNRLPIVIIGRIVGPIYTDYSLVHVYESGQPNKRIAVGPINDDYTFRVEVPSYGTYDIKIQFVTEGGLEHPGLYMGFHIVPGIQVSSPTTDLGTVLEIILPP